MSKRYKIWVYTVKTEHTKTPVKHDMIFWQSKFHRMNEAYYLL